jgi:hypothetical protein
MVFHTAGEHASVCVKPGYHRTLSLHSPLQATVPTKQTVVFTGARHWKHYYQKPSEESNRSYSDEIPHIVYKPNA